MFKFNITSFILLVALVWAMIFSINKCSSAKHYREGYEKSLESNLLWQQKKTEEVAKERKVLRDSIEYYRGEMKESSQRANKYKNTIRKLQDDFSKIKPSVEEIPYDSSYVFLSSLYEPTDTLQFSFTGNQVEELHIDYLEGVKSGELVEGLELENKYLNLSLIASGNMLVEMEQELDACDLAMKTMEEEIKKNVLDRKVERKKLWTYRVIAGVTSVVAILVLI